MTDVRPHLSDVVWPLRLQASAVVGLLALGGFLPDPWERAGQAGMVVAGLAVAALVVRTVRQQASRLSAAAAVAAPVALGGSGLASWGWGPVLALVTAGPLAWLLVRGGGWLSRLVRAGGAAVALAAFFPLWYVGLYGVGASSLALFGIAVAFAPDVAVGAGRWLRHRPRAGVVVGAVAAVAALPLGWLWIIAVEPLVPAYGGEMRLAMVGAGVLATTAAVLVAAWPRLRPVEGSEQVDSPL